MENLGSIASLTRCAIAATREIHGRKLCEARVDGQHASHQRIANAGEHFDCFCRLDAADDADQWREYAHRGTSLLFKVTAFLKQARVARRSIVTCVVNRYLPVEANGGTRDEWLSMFHTRTVDGVARGEAIAAIKYNISLGDRSVERRAK
jgi:hypothetical protein